MITKKQDSVCFAAEGNAWKGGMPLLLEEARFTVVKDGREHHKLQFCLIAEEEALLISTKHRGAKEPVVTSLEALLAPYMEPEDVIAFRRIVKSVYFKKLKQAS